jgi:hypothetical protein
MNSMHKWFLDNLRESGETNMFGAAPYLECAFPDMTRRQAREIVAEWMRTFSNEAIR